MRSAIIVWLVAASAAADLSIGRATLFADPPLISFSVVGLVPRDGGVTGFFRSTDKVLYAERLGESPGRTVLAGVDAARITADSTPPRLAWESNGVIYLAPLLEDDSVDLGAVKTVATGSLVTFGCNGSRCLLAWNEGKTVRAQIVDPDGQALGAVALDGPVSLLAVDPNGFLVTGAGKLLRVAIDGSINNIVMPELFGMPKAADFDGARYTVVGEGARSIAVASIDPGGAVGAVTMIVDQRATAHDLPYRSSGVQIVWNGTNHLVVTHQSTDFVVSDSFSWPLYATGFLLARDLRKVQVVGLGGTSSSPAGVAVSSNRFWVLWYDLPLVTWRLPYASIFFITGVTVSDDGTTKPLNILGYPPASESLVAVAASDAHVVGVWPAFQRVTHRYRVHAQADPNSVAVTVGESSVLSAAVANSGDAFLVTMRGEHGVEGVLRAGDEWKRVDLTSLGKEGGGVAVAANESGFLVATVDEGRMVTARIDRRGDVMSSTNEIGEASNATPIAAGSDGSGFSLLWTQSGSTIIAVVDDAGTVIGKREIGPAATSLFITWSGRDYVAVGRVGKTTRTWRLSRYGDLLLAFDTDRDAEPLSLARAGEGVVATWHSARSPFYFIAVLPPSFDWWSAPLQLNARFAAASRGNDALLFGWDYAGALRSVLATHAVLYAPATPRRRAAR